MSRPLILRFPSATSMVGGVSLGRERRQHCTPSTQRELERLWQMQDR